MIGDLSGQRLEAMLAGGPFLIKVSHQELMRDGRASSEQPTELVGAMHQLRKDGANAVIVSRAAQPALALVDDEVFEVRVPPLEPADPRGAGDSMTIDSPGLVALAAAAQRAGLEVVVAAPMRQSSGASAGIIAATREGRTLIEPRQLTDLPDVETYAVEAQPGYIVLAAVRGWLDPAPDLVLSGINHGANVGRAILHSGTIGAALTAGVNGLHGLAVSLDVGLRPAGAPHWDTAVHLLPNVLELLTDAPRGTVLTLNVPDRPVEALRELRHAVLAEFGTVQTRVDRVENGQLHLAEVEVDTQPAAGTDSALLAAGHPTLTALESVHEASGPVHSQWLASAWQRIA